MFAVSLEDYDQLVSLIYEAALDQTLWPRFIERLGATAGDAVVGLEARDVLGGSLGAINTHLPEFAESYKSYYATLNAWIPAYAAMPVGIAQQIDTHYARHRLVATEFYNDWLRPQDIVTAAGIVLHRDDHRFLALAVNLGHRNEELMLPMLELLDSLAPHLRRSFGLIRKLSKQYTVTFDESLDSLPTAILLIDGRGRLFHANARGEELLAAGTTLGFTHDRRIALVDPEAQDWVDKVLDAIGRGNRAGTSAAFTARGRGGAPAMQGNIIPFRPSSTFDGLPLSVLADDHPVAILALNHTSAPGALESLAARFRLSPAERRVADALCTGSTLQDFAAERGISIHTARNQLKSLMSKVGVSRQSQLVALLAGQVAPAE